jgi:hypothetical protein
MENIEQYNPAEEQFNPNDSPKGRRERRGRLITSFKPVHDRKNEVVGFENEMIWTNKSLRKNKYKLECEPFHYDAYDKVFSVKTETSFDKKTGRTKAPKYMIRKGAFTFCVYCNSHLCRSVMDTEKPLGKKSLKNQKHSSLLSRREERALTMEELREFSIEQ